MVCFKRYNVSSSKKALYVSQEIFTICQNLRRQFSAQLHARPSMDLVVRTLYEHYCDVQRFFTELPVEWLEKEKFSGDFITEILPGILTLMENYHYQIETIRHLRAKNHRLVENLLQSHRTLLEIMTQAHPYNQTDATVSSLLTKGFVPPPPPSRLAPSPLPSSTRSSSHKPLSSNPNPKAVVKEMQHIFQGQKIRPSEIAAQTGSNSQNHHVLSDDFIPPAISEISILERKQVAES